MELEPGATFGRYEIVERLGAGGMAVVYRAFHPALDRIVAIKVIRSDLTEDPEFVERFRAEAKAVARLRHPNIVQVHDFDVVDGRHFIVMEHVEGGSLDERLADLRERGKWLGAREAARVVSEIAEGLAHAHAMGILHRDVKPANVLLTRDGRAVVSDFGLARLASSGARTRTGTWMGTPEYMSPEQARGVGVDARSDVYSLGVIAYELFTGKRPYEGDSPLAIALARLHDPLPPPRQVAPTVGEATERVLVTALSLDPDQRYATATDLAQALSASIDADEGPSAEPGTRSRPVITVPPAAAAASVSAPVGVTPTAPPVATISISLPGTRSFAVIAAAVVVSAVIAGAVIGRAVLGSGAASAPPGGVPPQGGPPGAAPPLGLDLRGLSLSQLPKGTVAFERTTFKPEDMTLGPRSSASTVQVRDGAIRLTAGEPPGEVVLRGTARQAFVAETVIVVDPASDVRLELCFRITRAEERYCFAMTRESTELRYGMRDRNETIAKGAGIAPWAGEKTLTLFVQPSTFALYSGGAIVVEAQDTRLRQNELDLAIAASGSGETNGAVTLKTLRMWDLGPPR
jgi:serine/threonine-protein kinase